MLSRALATRRSFQLALVCVQLASTGCHRWEPVDQASPPTGLVRVHLRRGGSVDGQIIRETADSLYVQRADQTGVSVLPLPNDQIERIERRALSPARTAASGAAIAVGAFAIVAAIGSFVQSQRHHIS